MKKEELTLLQPGDEIDFKTYAFQHGIFKSAGIDTAVILGTTDQGALIKSQKFQGLTISVQAHNIVAARRVTFGQVQDIYVAIPGGQSHA